MDRLTKKLKKGGYSANRNPQEKLDERLEQLRGVHTFWMQEVTDMEEGIGTAESVGPEGDLSAMMMKTAYNAIVRIGRRFETVCPMKDNPDDDLTQLGKLEDLYEQCQMEVDDLREGLDECRYNGYTNDMAYNELMITKLGVSELIKRFEIAIGEREEEDPHSYYPESVKKNDL